jgi:hypothetical protein
MPAMVITKEITLKNIDNLEPLDKTQMLGHFNRMSKDGLFNEKQDLDKEEYYFNTFYKNHKTKGDKMTRTFNFIFNYEEMSMTLIKIDEFLETWVSESKTTKEDDNN